MAKEDFSEFSEAPDLSKVLTFGGRTGSRENFEALPLEVQDRIVNAAMAYNAKTGKTLQINSALRPLADQQRLYDETVAAGRPGIGPSGMPVAKPGKSKHGTGYAIDIQQGKDDKDAVAILNQFGLRQTVKNDPVHFELTPTQPRQTPEPQSTLTAAMTPPEPVRTVQPQPAPKQPMSLSSRINQLVQNAPTPGQFYNQQVVPTLAGITQGTFAGLAQYPAAGLVSLASQVAPQGAPLTLGQALSQVRETQKSIKEENPLAYTAGQIVGGASMLGRATRGMGIAGTAGVAGAMGATEKFTESPETTVGRSLIQGAAEGVTSAIAGGAAKGLSTAATKVGESSFGGYVRNLVESGARSDQRRLVDVFGPAYKEAKKIAEQSRPKLEKGRAGEVLPKYERQLAAWEKRNADLVDLPTFASRYAENPKLIEKYSRLKNVPEKQKSAFQKKAEAIPERLNAAATGQAARDYFYSGVITPVVGSGLAGAGLAVLTGQDPLTAVIGGSVAGTAARFGLPAAARQYYTSPGVRQASAQVGAATRAVAPQVAGQVTERIMTEKPISPWDEFPEEK